MTTKDTDRYIDKPFNIRPICFWALFVAVTVVMCLWSRSAGVWVVAAWFAVLFAGFVLLQFTKANDKVLSFLGSSRVFFIGTVVLCVAVAFSFAVTGVAYSNQKTYAGYGELSGVVLSHGETRTGSLWFVLDDARFEGEALGGKVMVYVSGFGEDDAACVVSTNRVAVVTMLSAAEPSESNINNRIKYVASTSGEVTALGLDESFKSEIARESKGFLGRFLSDENRDLMHSMLFGDQSVLDGELRMAFSVTGLAHVLSVSGLHVGLIIGLLMVLLKSLRVPRGKQLPIIIAVLLFYCYLCNFGFAIMRASIMFLVFMVNRIFLRSNDMLSSLSLAAVVVLLLFPYSLMSVSFQLSFACMFGIALFYLPIKNFFKRVFRSDAAIVRFIGEGISMYLATTVACFPLLVHYFGYVSIVGLFANLIALPLFIIGFQITVIALVTVVAFPLLYICNLLLDIATGLMEWFSALPLATVRLSDSGYLFLLYFVGLVLVTRFIFAPRKYKYSAAAVLVGVYLLSLVL